MTLHRSIAIPLNNCVALDRFDWSHSFAFKQSNASWMESKDGRRVWLSDEEKTSEKEWRKSQTLTTSGSYNRESGGSFAPNGIRTVDVELTELGVDVVWSILLPTVCSAAFRRRANSLLSPLTKFIMFFSLIMHASLNNLSLIWLLSSARRFSTRFLFFLFSSSSLRRFLSDACCSWSFRFNN